MRQEVQVIVRLTFDADASLSRDELMAAIKADIYRLADAPTNAPLILTHRRVESLREEAEIYGNV